jgi:hypothetical protein
MVCALFEEGSRLGAETHLSPEFGDFDDLDRVLAGEMLDAAFGGF